MKVNSFLSNSILLTGLVFLIFVGCKDNGLADIKTYNYDGETVNDADGNLYHTITIGNQVWMAENLKTTKYSDGTAIRNITDNAQWIADTLGAYCNYDNDDENVDTYGRLYNWYAVNSGKLCPTGFHIPTEAEWDVLVSSIHSDSIYLFDNTRDSVGINLKAPFGWSNDGGGTDDYKFRALPAGSRQNFDGSFNDQGDYGYWWSLDGTSRTEILGLDTLEMNIGYYRYLTYFADNLKKGDYSSALGLSVRCIKDAVE